MVRHLPLRARPRQRRREADRTALLARHHLALADDDADFTVSLVHSDDLQPGTDRIESRTRLKILLNNYASADNDGQLATTDAWLSVSDARAIAAALTRHIEMLEADTRSGARLSVSELPSRGRRR